MKGEERVCHVTEADTPGAMARAAKAGAVALDVSGEVSSCEAACVGGVLPLCAAAYTALPEGKRLGSSAKKGIWWMPWH